MSVHRDDVVSYDGDFIHGHIKVNYWTDLDKVQAEVDKQVEALRAQVAQKWAYLTGGNLETGKINK